MNFSVWLNVMWLLGFLEHIALALILLLRRRLKAFPSVTVFVLSRIVDTAALFLISRFGSKHMYFVMYWVDEFSAEPFLVWMIVDIYRDVLKPLETWGRNRPKILWAFVILAVITSAAYSVGIGAPGLKGFDLWQGREDVFTSMVMTTLLIGVSFFEFSNGLPSRPHAIVVMYGLFAISYSSLIVACIHTVYGWDRPLHSLDYVCKVLYLAVIAYWSFVFWSSERKPPPLPPEALAYMKALHERIAADLATLDDHTGTDPVGKE